MRPLSAAAAVLASPHHLDKTGPSDVMLAVDMAKDDLGARLMLAVTSWYTVTLLLQLGTSTLQYSPAGMDVWYPP